MKLSGSYMMLTTEESRARFRPDAADQTSEDICDFKYILCMYKFGRRCRLEATCNGTVININLINSKKNQEKKLKKIDTQCV